MKLVSSALMLVLLAMASGAFCQGPPSGFPLWGSTWVVSDGANKGVYRTSLKLAPKDIVKLAFSGDRRTVYINWANCKTRQYNSTSSLLSHIEREFQLRSMKAMWSMENSRFEALYGGKTVAPIDIQYQDYNDTLWTAHKQVKYLLQNHGYTAAVISCVGEEKKYVGPAGIQKLNEELEDGSAYTLAKPVAYLQRRETEKDVQTFDYLIQYGDEDIYIENMETHDDEIKRAENSKAQALDLQRYVVPHYEDEYTVMDARDQTDYRQGGYMYEYTRHLDCKTERIGYWQVHVHPVVIYYPRDPYSGDPVVEEELAMDWETARKKKKQSLEEQENADLLYYRNPWLDEKNSCIVSFQFSSETEDLTMRDYVWLDAKKAGTKMDYSHTPSRMYNARGGVHKAIYKQYTETEEETELAEAIDSRCPGWRAVDKLVGNEVYPTYDSETGKYTRNRAINDQIFTYGDCPCYYEDKYGGLTLAQLKRYVFMPIATCRKENVDDALAFYKKIRYDMEGEKRVVMLIWEKIQRLEYLSTKSGNAEFNAMAQRLDWSKISSEDDLYAQVDEILEDFDAAAEAVCPRSWTDTETIQGIIQ